MVDAVRPVHRLVARNPGGLLRSGQIISAKVDALLSNGRVRLFVGGKSLIAKTTLSLKAGQTLRALVEASSDGTRLRLLSAGKTAGNPTENAKITPRQILSAALLRAGLPVPDAAELDRQAVLLSRSRGSRTRLARLYAELRTRGADPSADFLEYLDAVLSPGSGGGSNDSGERPPRRRWLATPDAGELAGELGSEENTAADGDEAILSLFNAVDGRDGSWVLQRFSRVLDGTNLSCVVKFRKGSPPGMALTVQDGDRLFEFLLDGLDPLRITVYSDENVEIDTEKWERFDKTLSLMNILLSDTILPITESDGFSRGTDETSYVLEAMGESS